MAAILLLLAVGVVDDLVIAATPRPGSAAELAAGGLMVAAGAHVRAAGRGGSGGRGRPGRPRRWRTPSTSSTGRTGSRAASVGRRGDRDHADPRGAGWLRARSARRWSRPCSPSCCGTAPGERVPRRRRRVRASAVRSCYSPRCRRASWPGAARRRSSCLGVFGLELGSTVLRRAIRRESLTSGDRDHVYDLLAVRLGSRTSATATMVVAAGLVLAGLGLGGVEVPLAARPRHRPRGGGRGVGRRSRFAVEGRAARTTPFAVGEIRRGCLGRGSGAAYRDTETNAEETSRSSLVLSGGLHAR